MSSERIVIIVCKVYISGPITNVDNYKRMFNIHAALLSSMGYDVFNPANVSIDDGTWHDYMQFDLAMLRTCDAIYMLPNWQHSKGACIERRYAKRIGIRVL